MNAQESKMAREVLDLVDELDRFVGKADAFLVDWENLCGKLDNLKHKFFAGQEVKSTIKTPQDVSPSKPDIKSPRKTNIIMDLFNQFVIVQKIIFQQLVE